MFFERLVVNVYNKLHIKIPAIITIIIANAATIINTIKPVLKTGVPSKVSQGKIAFAIINSSCKFINRLSNLLINKLFWFNKLFEIKLLIELS